MHVDGGRSLTSRGHQDWYGSLIMNRLFEQDGLAAMSKALTKMIKLTAPEEAKPSQGEGLYHYVEGL